MKEKIKYAKYCPNVWVAKCENQHEKGDIIEIETSRGNVHECEVHNFLGRTNDGMNVYSITRTDGTNKATMAARMAERRNEWASKREVEADDYWARSGEGLPDNGQPILVGHHSEKKHRAALERSWSRMEHAHTAGEIAKTHREKAEYWERKSEEITLDMPESLEYFKSELEKAVEYHQGLKTGKYERTHSYSLTYAKKAVNELAKKVEIATKLWG